jgi:Alpha/beta hydrolase
VLDLTRVAAAVQAAFGRSQEGWNALGVSVPAAQRLAEHALALAALAEAGPAGWPLVPGDAMAAEALAEAAVAATAARAAEDAVSGLAGLVAGSPPPAVPDLLARLGPLHVPAVPAGLPPPDVAAWWAGLSAAEQDALVQQSPDAVGSLDGVPAWARDRANRLLLDGLLEDAVPDDVARAAHHLDARIRAEEAAGRTVQLHLLDLAGDRVVLSLGDLDTADTVALLVPGVLTTPDDDLGALVADARAVAAASEAATAASTVAAVVWLGYRTPQNLWTMARRTTAVEGGRALDAALDGLAASRAAAGSATARTTVLAHSYGTVVVDEAADQPGPLAADAVVLLGSPGMEDDAASLEAPEVYDAGSVGDPVSWSGLFGMPPSAPAFGSTGLPTDLWAGHSEYYDTDQPTLAAIGEVVAGVRDGY